jgi:hypothetical protein
MYNINIKVKKLLDAAEIEEVVKKLGGAFRLDGSEPCEDFEFKPKLKPRKNRTQNVVNPDIVQRVVICHKKHPDWTVGHVKKNLNLPHSNNTIRRIINREYDASFYGDRG